ncbi:DUF2252 family protein [Nocardia australiensis]|uniref:DUF2252 family protein n=1 Tax=Nocardia australiensis TaxID=2887191 RepID=UPI001D140931|nr:DUF2252 family protein [Nocardia australiensis]
MSDSGIGQRTYVPDEEVRARGRALRERVPVTARDRPATSATRPSVLEFLDASNAGRLPHLVPLRIGRMMASPFTFYRGTAGLMAADLADVPFMQSWTALPDESVIGRTKADALLDDFKKAAKKARKNNSAKVVAKWTEHLEDHRTGIRRHRFVSDPPILTPLADDIADAVIDGLAHYGDTLPESRRTLLARFAVSDIAFRIVGTGSVGLRSYVALLHGNAGVAPVLQVKQANPSALSAFLPATRPRHKGERIVRGARLVQSESDILLGWTSLRLPEGELPFIVRQFRNLEGDIDPAQLPPEDLDDYGRLAGALLARAHSRSVDPRLLAGYLDGDDSFDEAVARFAIRYADRTEADHAELVAAVGAGKVPAEQPQ